MTKKQKLELTRIGKENHWHVAVRSIGRVMQSTVGMYGDLQGIAGKSLREIEGLSLPALEDDSGS